MNNLHNLVEDCLLSGYQVMDVNKGCSFCSNTKIQCVIVDGDNNNIFLLCSEHKKQFDSIMSKN